MNNKCQHPHCENPGTTRRQNTQYVDDELNWKTYCEEHQEEADEYWNDRWSEYWQMVMD